MFPTDSPLRRVIYVSRAREAFDEATLIGFCQDFATHNQRTGLSGLLIHLDGRFLQVIEGTPTAINTLMPKILRDARHTDIQIIHRERMTRRAFSQWSMGLLDLQRSDGEQTSLLGELARLTPLVARIDEDIDAPADVVRLVRSIPKLVKIYRLPRSNGAVIIPFPRSGKPES